MTLGEIEAWASGFPSNEAAVRRTREAAAAAGADADAVIVRSGAFFGEEPGTAGEAVNPRTVSFTVTAIRFGAPARPSPWQ